MEIGAQEVSDSDRSMRNIQAEPHDNPRPRSIDLVRRRQPSVHGIYLSETLTRRRTVSKNTYGAVVSLAAGVLEVVCAAVPRQTEIDWNENYYSVNELTGYWAAHTVGHIDPRARI